MSVMNNYQLWVIIILFNLLFVFDFFIRHGRSFIKRTKKKILLVEKSQVFDFLRFLKFVEGRRFAVSSTRPESFSFATPG